MAELISDEELRESPFDNWDTLAVWHSSEDVHIQPTARKLLTKSRPKLCRRGSLVRVAHCTFFDAVVLCTWTDLFGPQCRHIWLGSVLPSTSFHTQLLKVLPRLTTSGELTRELDNDGSCATRYYRLPAEGFELGTFVFLAEIDGSNCRCALSLIKKLPDDKLSKYLALYQICQERMTTLIKKLVTQLKKTEELTTAVLLRFTDDLAPFMIAVNHLGSSCNDEDDFQESQTTISPMFAGTVLNASKSSPRCFSLPRPFLDICITSHLQTSGRCVIVGSDLAIVRRLLKTLALFLSPYRLYSSPKKYSTAPSGNLFGSVLPNMKYKSNQIFTPFTDERESVRYDFGDRLYEPDLVLQAVSSSVIDLRMQVFEANSPSTIIDLDRHIVRRTHSRDVYATEHERHERARLDSIEGKTTRIYGNKLSEMTNPAPLVRAFLDALNAEPARRHPLQLSYFLRSLERTALVLIELSHGSRATPERPLPANKRDKIREVLNLKDYQDFEIILAMSWKLDNESYARILGDVREREDHLSSFFSYNDT